ncbi:MAG: SMP-30/gluconolactonase/LRE family protein, partial [Actinomycetota bacterium]
TLIIGETMAFRLSAFDIATDGTLSNRRVWAQLDFVGTDGMCLDGNGDIWVANAFAPECLHVREGGQIIGRVTTSQNSYACMLGGPAGDSLYILTAAANSRFDVAETRDGKVEIVTVASPRAGRP